MSATGPPAPGHDVVWLLSYTDSAAERLLDQFRGLSARISREFVVWRAAFAGGTGPSAAPPIAPGSHLAAAVLVIEREGLDDPAYRAWAGQCIQLAANRDDFRLFVVARDVGADDLETRADQGDDLLADLVDSVQMPVTPSDRLPPALETHLRDADRIRAASLWRDVRLTLAVVAGRIGGATQKLAGLAVVAGGVAALIDGEHFLAGESVAAPAAVFAFLAGLPFFGVTAPVLHFALTGAVSTRVMLRRDGQLGRTLVLFGLLGPAALFLPHYAGAPAEWNALGLAAGVLLDVARRGGRQATRARLRLDRALAEAKDPCVAAGLLASLRHRVLLPFVAPILPAAAPHVFISYTRSSPWSVETATRLHESVQRQGGESFLDRVTIGEGASWRRQLDRGIADANVFVAVIDERSLRRPWVAAEMLTALAGHVLTTAPQVVVLVNPALRGAELDDALPILRAVLRDFGTPGLLAGPRVIVASQTAVETLSSELAPHRAVTSSVIPSRLAAMILLPSIPAVALGALAAPAGLIAVVFGVLQSWERFDSAGRLASWHGLVPACLVVAYWLGFAARLVIASRAETRPENPAQLAKIHVVAAFGHLVLLGAWAGRVEALVLGWAVVLAGTGWVLASAFVGRITQSGEARRVRSPGGPSERLG